MMVSGKVKKLVYLTIVLIAIIFLYMCEKTIYLSIQCEDPRVNKIRERKYDSSQTRDVLVFNDSGIRIEITAALQGGPGLDNEDAQRVFIQFEMRNEIPIVFKIQDIVLTDKNDDSLSFITDISRYETDNKYGENISYFLWLYYDISSSINKDEYIDLPLRLSVPNIHIDTGDEEITFPKVMLGKMN